MMQIQDVSFAIGNPNPLTLYFYGILHCFFVNVPFVWITGWSVPTIAMLVGIVLFIWRYDKYHEPDLFADLSLLHQV